MYLLNFCTLCLSPNDKLTNILSADNDGIIVQEKIKVFLLELENMKPDVPKYVCNNCLENLNNIYKFRLKCLETITTLKEYLQKFEVNESYKNLSVTLNSVNHGNEQQKESTYINQSNNEINVRSDLFEMKDSNGLYQSEEKKNPVGDNVILSDTSDENVEDKYVIPNNVHFFEQTSLIDENLIKKENETIYETNNSPNPLTSTHEPVQENSLNDNTTVNKKQEGIFNNTQPSFNFYPVFIEEKHSEETNDNPVSTNNNPGNPIASSEEQFKCKDCHKEFNTIILLKKHSRRHCENRPYKCPTCDKTFKMAQHLKTHKLIHTGEKPFKCDMCDRAFCQIAHLTYHKREHTGERPFHCQLCQYRGRKSSDLNRHMLTHTGEKPFQCNICPQQYSQAAHLKYHMNKHIDAKCFICRHCQEDFKTLDDLNKHVNQEHFNN